MTVTSALVSLIASSLPLCRGIAMCHHAWLAEDRVRVCGLIEGCPCRPLLHPKTPPRPWRERLSLLTKGVSARHGHVARLEQACFGITEEIGPGARGLRKHRGSRVCQAPSTVTSALPCVTSCPPVTLLPPRPLSDFLGLSSARPVTWCSAQSRTCPFQSAHVGLLSSCLARRVSLPSAYPKRFLCLPCSGSKKSVLTGTVFGTWGEVS